MARKVSLQDKSLILPMFLDMPVVDMKAMKKRAIEDVELLKRLESENARLQEDISRAKAIGADTAELMRLNARLNNQRSAVFDRVSSWKAMGLIDDGG
jgi:hypothetical protein